MAQCRRPSSCYTSDISTSELLGVLVVVIVTWLVLKLARVAIRLIFFIIGLMLVAGALYFFLSR